MAKGRRVLWYSREQKNVLESRTPARGGLHPLPCQESFAGKMGVTVHRTWVSKSTYDTLKYRNCSSFFRQKFQGLKVHLYDKDRLQGDLGRCGTACFVPCFFVHSLAKLAEATATRGSAGLGCLWKWWQQVFHTPGELTCGFSQLCVNMLTVVLQILSLILCSCFCFSALFSVSILGGWDILGFFHLCFCCSLPLLYFLLSLACFLFGSSLPAGAGAVSYSWCCA